MAPKKYPVCTETDKTKILAWARRFKKRVDFPLTVHPSGNGYWVKKVHGVQHRFGPLTDPQTALEQWLEQKDDILAGREPTTNTGDTTVRELLNRFLTDAEQRVNAGELANTSFREFRYAAKMVVNTFGKNQTISSISPSDFANLRQSISNTGRNLRSQKNMILQIRAMFRWCHEMQLCEAITFGPRFKPPTTNAIERERQVTGKSRFFDREILLQLIEAAEPEMKAIILLGLNCGFQPSDIIELTTDTLHLDVDPPHHSLARIKNGQCRRAVLWPETVAAIRQHYETRIEPASKADGRFVFLSVKGKRHIGQSGAKLLAKYFRKLYQSCSLPWQSGVGIGSLRHTFGTMLDLVPDEQIRSLMMGHVPKSIQQRIYSQFNIGELDRLKVAADTLHRYLFEGKVG